MTPTLPTRTSYIVWPQLTPVAPDFTRAVETAKPLHPDIYDPIWMTLCHAALLEMERDCILSSGGFND